MAFSFPFQQSSPNPFQQQPQTPQQPQFQFQPQQPQFQTPQQPQQHYSLLPQQPQQPQQHYSLLPQPQLQQQQGQQPTFLFKADRSPAGYSTKWEELHPDSQKILLQIEERILEYRNESQILDQCSRLFDSSVANNGFELDATRIIQELGGISIAIDREKVSAQELMTSVKSMMRNTEFAVRSFIILHPRFLHTRTAITSNGTVGSQTGGATSAFNAPIQPAASAMQPFDFYSGVLKRPSPFFTNTLAEFEKYLAQCRQWIEELEQLLHVDTKNTFATMGTSLESLPPVLSNVYDYFIYVAAKVENLHQYIESMKTAYLGDQRQRGDVNDPFLEADRREAAKVVAAARRIHPTLHLPAICSRPSQDAGLHVNSSIPMPSTVAHQPQGSTGASSGSGSLGLSVPSTAAASASTPSFLFSTPSSSAPTSTLFGSAGFSPHSTPLVSAQTSLFGASTPAFTSTPPVGSSSLFTTPSFGPGPTIGSGASFGGTSKSSKPRSRAPNRR